MTKRISRSAVKLSASSAVHIAPAPAPTPATALPAAAVSAGSELVFGVVYSVGTDYIQVIQNLENHLKIFGYEPEVIRLSDTLEKIPSLGASRAITPEFRRINAFMDAGNKLRVSSREAGAREADAVALLGVAEIKSRRNSTGGPGRRAAYILHSLKHPDEVFTLRKIYGPGFFLIGVHTTEKDRIKHLVEDKGLAQEQAEKLLARDSAEEDSFGQQTRKTFQLADVFVHEGGTAEINRFVDLVFGKNTTTPFPDEHAMFVAYAASTRSADLSRQVGAAIVSRDGDLISVGANDIPRFGGGLYWPDALGTDEDKRQDQRDWVLGQDYNQTQREEIEEDIIRRIKPLTGKVDEKALRSALRKSRLFDISEYGRAVHAEMEAIVACGRIGANPRGGTLFSTTFPCHMCAKHIVAAGIERVVYIEPYAKSKAHKMHSDSMEFRDKPGESPSEAGKVRMEHFIGVGPQRFFDLFSMRLSTGYAIERNIDGKLKEWHASSSNPRVPLLSVHYLKLESGFVDNIGALLSKMKTPKKKGGK